MFLSWHRKHLETAQSFICHRCLSLPPTIVLLDAFGRKKETLILDKQKRRGVWTTAEFLKKVSGPILLVKWRFQFKCMFGTLPKRPLPKSWGMFK
jgi:hypothetical protein